MEILNKIKQHYREYKAFSSKAKRRRRIQVAREERWISECRRRGEIFPISEFK